MSRRLGQHFLKNRQKLRKIADSLEIERGDTVIEIGPGHGELTEFLVKEFLVVRIVAVEKDKHLSELLIRKFATNKRVEVIAGDALKILPEITKNYQLKTKNFKVVGNIPYYITGHLFRIIGELITSYELPITTVVFTIQKEVAERICAKPPKMNLLAAAVQFWAEPEIIDYIPRKDFSPPPKVDSAIIKLKTKNQQLTTETENYYEILKILFKQPRKTILNNLTNITKSDFVNIGKSGFAELLKKLKINPSDRPQNLNIEEIVKLSQELKTEHALNRSDIRRKKHQEI